MKIALMFNPRGPLFLFIIHFHNKFCIFTKLHENITLMKKLLLTIAILIIPIWVLIAQGEISYRILIDDQQVPKEVRMNFRKHYPESIMSLWYTSHITYWYEDYAPGWYGEWYPTRRINVHKFERPAYYEVDFQIDGEPSRAIFSRYGLWIETRTKIKNLPEAVILSLEKSEYGDWLWSDHKERINIPGMPEPIYRLQVSNRKFSYVVRLNGSGEIIQVKYE